MTDLAKRTWTEAAELLAPDTVAILPIAQTSEESFVGQEYLGLYPYIDGSALTLWVNRGAAPTRLFRGQTNYKQFREWLAEQRSA